MKFHCFSCEANDSLAEMEKGRHCSAGVFPFGSLRKEQEKREEGETQWQFGGFLADPRIPQIRLCVLGEVREGTRRESGKHPNVPLMAAGLALVTYSSVSGGRRLEAIFIVLRIKEAKIDTRAF